MNNTEIDKHRKQLYNSFIFIMENTNFEQAIGEIESIKMFAMIRAIHKANKKFGDEK